MLAGCVHLACHCCLKYIMSVSTPHVSTLKQFIFSWRADLFHFSHISSFAIHYFTSLRFTSNGKSPYWWVLCPKAWLQSVWLDFNIISLQHQWSPSGVQAAVKGAFEPRWLTSSLWNKAEVPAGNQMNSEMAAATFALFKCIQTVMYRFCSEVKQQAFWVL